MHTKLEASLELAQAGELAPAINELERTLNEAASDDLRLQAEAHELLGRCYQGQLGTVQAQEAFAEASRLYSLLGDPEAAAYCQLLKVRQLLDERLLPQARELITAAQVQAGRQGWRNLRALACEFGGLASMHVKENASAVRLLVEAIASPDRRKLPWELLVLRMALATCYLALGELSRGRSELTEVNNDPRTMKIPRLGAFALMNRGYADWLVHDFPAARQSFLAVAELSRQALPVSAGMQWLLNMASYNLGLVEIQLGDYPQAHQQLLAAWQITREHGHYQLACASLNSLCITSLMLDELDSALRYARLCHELVQQYDDIETHLTPYYSAIVYLANDLLDQAAKTWSAKPLLEDNSETLLQYGWLVRLLDHLQASPGIVLTPNARELVRQWRGEVLAQAGGRLA